MYHNPVLLKESIDGLNIKPDGIYVDVTFGGGGHSKEILNRLGENGKLIAFDQDIDAEANILNDTRLLFVKANFRFLKNFLKYNGFEKVDGILADLGVSSHHFDDKQRGFSYRFDSSIDMRMNTKSEKSAISVINEYPLEKLKQIFKEYGEIKNAYKLSLLIDTKRRETEITTTTQFIEAIVDCTPKFQEHKYLAKVFQAIRIEVNNEMTVLKKMLEQSIDVLKNDGRLSVITYHSLEDRIVKNFIKGGNSDGKIEKDFYGNVLSPFEAVNRKIILPTDEELEINTRARSAKLRIAKRIIR